MSNKKIDFFQKKFYYLIKDKERITMKVSPNSLENLHPFQKGDTRDKAENGRLGGYASGEAKREAKRMREALEFVLNSPVEESKRIYGEETTQLMLGMSALARKMQAGDVKAAEFIRDLIGEKPETKITVQDLKTVPYVVEDKNEQDS